MKPPGDGSAIGVILFCDVVASTDLRARLGEDAADQLTIDLGTTLAKEVERHGGCVVKGTGDGLVAAFKGAVDALAGATAVQQASPHPLRVGLSTGEVTWRGGDCFGAPVVEAARLCDAAAGGEILVADVVRVLARGRGPHRFEVVGELQLKGLPDRVPVSRLGWDPDPSRRAAPLPRPFRHRLGEPFVGRAEELALLERLWARASEGARQLVLVGGEPGAGKTRLVCEFARRMHDAEAVSILFGGARPPYPPSRAQGA